MTSPAAVSVHASTPGERQDILALYPRAFPDEELRPLVAALLDETDSVVSLIARSGGAVLGHVVFTVCGLEGSNRRLALLGPLCVDPAHQRQGVGGALVRDGLARMAARGAARACVLGDPDYYGRFGFQPETRITPPYPLPAEWRGAWQSLNLENGGETLRGRMTVPLPWRDPALWS